MAEEGKEDIMSAMDSAEDPSDASLMVFATPAMPTERSDIEQEESNKKPTVKKETAAATLDYTPPPFAAEAVDGAKYDFEVFSSWMCIW